MGLCLGNDTSRWRHVRGTQKWVWNYLVPLAGLNMVELASLNIVELANLNSAVDRLVHACWTGMLVHSLMNERTWTTTLNTDVTTTMNLHGCSIKSGFACSNIREQPLSIRQAVTICWNIIEQYTVILPILFYRVNSVVTGSLSQQSCNSLQYFYV